MTKVTFIFVMLVSGFTYGQTVTIPATTIPYNPATNTISVPATVLNINPTPVVPPITIAQLLALHLNIVSVEYKSGIHEVVGYNAAGALVTPKVQFGLHNVLAVSKFTKPKLSIITIPFKVRAALDTFPSKAQAGLTNIGLSLNLLNYKMDRYFSSGTKSTHSLSAGIFLAPNVEEITPETTKNKVLQKSSQLFLSTGLTVIYSYSDVSFLIVPVGFDFGTTNSAKKYIYDGKYWWGFGIGLSLKILGL